MENRNKSVLENLPGAQPVDPKKLEKLEEGMKKLAEGWRERQVERLKANAIARGWIAK